MPKRVRTKSGMRCMTNKGKFTKNSRCGLGVKKKKSGSKKRKASSKAGVKKVRVKGVGMRCKATRGKNKGKFVKNSRCGL